jgi:putative thiamine transport system permease protein
MLLPVFAGLSHTFFSALEGRFSWQESEAPLWLWSEPGWLVATGLTLWTGWAATALTLISAILIVSYCYQSRIWRTLERSLAPMLAVPHVALAIALLFLLAPSGWMVRLFSPWASGFNYPPDWTTTQDPWGLTLILTLWLKELPYILFVILAALKQLPWRQSLALGQSLGYSDTQVWWRLILVPLLKPLRLPILAALAFSLAVVDVAQVIGPGQPGTLAVMIWQWYNDSSSSYWTLASQGSLWLLVLVAMSLGAAYTLLQLLEKRLIVFSTNGQRKASKGRLGLKILVGWVIGSYVAALAVMLVWSFSWRWRFPDFWPSSWSVKHWISGSESLLPALLNSATLGLASAGLSLILVVGCLEYECALRQKRPHWKGASQTLLLYLPLLTPQLAFLFGAQQQLLRLHLDATFIGVLWAHMVFVLPYVFITVANSYRQFDERYLEQAQSFGCSRVKALFRIKWPMLSAILWLGFAVGFAVSSAQYLPTMFVGGGRITTLTTEAVALASGGDRRLTAVVVLWQSALPLFIYGVAQAWPKWRYRNRLGML